MADLAFITEVHNGEAYLSKAIESVLNQTYGDFIYYLADDGSTDNTFAVIEDYASRDSRIRPYRFSENRMHENFNRVLRDIYDSPARYFALLDADDWYEPDFAEILVGALEETGADLSEARFCAHYENDPAIEEPQPSLGGNLLITREEFAKNFAYFSFFDFFQQWWGKVYRLSLLRRLKLYPGVGWDTEFVLLCRTACEKTAFVDRVLHHYLVREDSDCHKKLSAYLPDRAFQALSRLHEERLALLKFGGTDEGNLMAAYQDLNGVKSEFMRLQDSLLGREEQVAAVCTLLDLPYLEKSFAQVTEAYHRDGTLFDCRRPLAKNAVARLMACYRWALRTAFTGGRRDGRLFCWLRRLFPDRGLADFFSEADMALLFKDAPRQNAILGGMYRQGALLLKTEPPEGEEALLRAFVCLKTGEDKPFLRQFLEKRGQDLTERQRRMIESTLPPI